MQMVYVDVVSFDASGDPRHLDHRLIIVDVGSRERKEWNGMETWSSGQNLRPNGLRKTRVKSGC
jgi:hypothetical protein